MYIINGEVFSFIFKMTGTFSSPREKIAKVTCKVKKVFKKEFVSTLKKKNTRSFNFTHALCQMHEKHL